MKDNFEKQYRYYADQIPDIEGLSRPFINTSDVLLAYFVIADYFTNPLNGEQEKMLIGVRDLNLLGSAIGRQVVGFDGKRKYRDKIDICATLFYGLVKNHFFSDGNKRTALLVLLYQLDRYGYMPNAPQKDFEKLVICIAANKIPERYPFAYKKCRKDEEPIIKTISKILRKKIKKKDNTYHVRRIEGCRLEDYAETVPGKKTMYQLVDDFKSVFRRLKDE